MDKVLTVFFADVKGSTSMIEKLDPEESRELLEPVLHAMMTSVHKYGGTVINSAGDGIIAIFGAPIAAEDHALRACFAALDLQNSVKKMKSQISIRIGLDSGAAEVVVFESDVRKEYGVIGPVLHIGSQMEQTAMPNTIQITANTWQLVKESVSVKSKGTVTLKDTQEQVQVFELLETFEKTLEVQEPITLKPAPQQSVEGARKQLTVLFTYLLGQTFQLETKEALDHVLEAMTSVIHAYGGTVIKSGVTGIVALFGAPIAYEDHAVRACYAALQLQKAIREMNGEISVKIGLNSGEVVVDLFGVDVRKEYDATGFVVSIAARMQQLAESNMIQLSPDTVTLVKDSVYVNSRGKMAVKGVSEPMEVFELTGLKPNFTRFLQLRSSKLSHFVGRNKELKKLEETFDEVIQGRGSVVGIVGEPGEGKSRLAYEFMDISGAKNYQQLASQCQAILMNNPFFPIKQILKNALGISGTEPVSTVIEALKNHNVALAEYLNICLSILDYQIDDPEWNAYAPEFKRRKIISGFAKLFVALYSQQPIILLIEDLQWMDTESLECIKMLIDELHDKRIFVIATYRPEFKQEWSAVPSFIEIPINPLQSDDFYALATSILGTNPDLETLKHTLVERCKGNPFFFEEMIRSLIDHKDLGGSYGNYSLLQALDKVIFPGTIQALLDARIDLLSPDRKKLIRICSVVGKVVPVNLVRTVIDFPEADLEESLNALVCKNFISKTQDFPEVLYTFSHDMILESIYHSILKSQRKAIHQTLLNSLEVNFPSKSLEQLTILANHSFQSDSWNKSLHYYSTLELQTYARSALLEAIVHYERVAQSYHSIAQPGSDESVAYFQCILCEGYMVLWLGKFDVYPSLIQDAYAVANRLQDRYYEAIVKVVLDVRDCLRLSEYNKIIKLSEEAQVIVDNAGKRTGAKLEDLQGLINFAQFHGHYYLGNYLDCIDYARRVFEYATSPITRVNICGLSLWPAWSATMKFCTQAYCMTGNFSAAKKNEEVILGYLEHQSPSLEVYVELQTLGISFYQRREFSQALKYIDLALETASLMGIKAMFGSILFSIKGLIYIKEKKLKDAEECLDRAYTIATMQKLAFWGSEALHLICKGYISLQKLERAKIVLHDMFLLAETRGQKGLEVFAWALKAKLELLEGKTSLEEIEAMLQKSIKLAEQRSMLPHMADCYTDLSELYTQWAKLKSAEHARTKAGELFKKMGM